jgi:hypothetical protein
MHPTQKLTRVLRNLIALVEEEAKRNPAFSERLDVITSGLPNHRRERSKKPKLLGPPAPLPDVAAAFQEKGDEEFRFWLRGFDLQILKAIIKINGFDPAKASQRWKEPDKFVALIGDQTAARLRRGAAFLPPKSADSKSSVP